MSKKQNIPELRFPGFEGKWEVIPLGKLLEFKNGINASKEQYGRGIKFINVLDILNSITITYDSIIGSIDINADTLEKYAVTYGDVLFQRSSETREEVGTASVYLDSEKTASFGGFVIRGKKVGKYDPFFLGNLLKSKSVRDSITSRSGGSTRFNVGQEILSSVSVTLPTSLPEQQKIASFLSKVDEKLTLLKKKKELLEQYKKGMMQKIFSQEVRFKPDGRTGDDGEEFPDWEEKRLGDVSKFSKGKGLPKSEIVEDGEIECVRYGELYTHYGPVIDKVKSKTNSSSGDLVLSEANDVIIPASGETEIDIATAACVTRSGIALGGDINIIKTKNNGVYLSYYLNSKKKFEIANLAQGISVIHLYAKQLAVLEIELPCIAEQTKIAAFLSALDQKITHTQSQIHKTEQWKKGLLQQLFV